MVQENDQFQQKIQRLFLISLINLFTVKSDFHTVAHFDLSEG